LQHRLTSRQHDKSPIWRLRRPSSGDGLGTAVSRDEAPAADTIDPDKVDIAESADGGRSVNFVARPQVATKKRQKTATRPVYRPSP
jgi:hypothetical protein